MNKLSTINNTFESYQKLITFYENNKNELFSDIHIEMRGFFSANMSAVLGSIIDKFKENLNNIHFDYIQNDISIILQKNDFLTYYGMKKEHDNNHTTIQFKKLRPTDGKYFKTYVIEELINRKEMPNISVALKEKIVEAIYEIFVNAQTHSETNFIYTCGQYFPNKKMIEFTLVDTGIGFKNNVNRRFNSNLNSQQAIKWAVQDRKTTKIGVSGGIGLTLLKELVILNRGKMQIISDNGFYQLDNNEILKAFIGSFPGSIINLQFRTDDKINYILKSEIDINDIF